MYQYAARLVSVYDGDTVHLDLDLGLSVWLRGRRYRLARIDAPELPTPEGIAARDALIARLGTAPLVATTTKDRADAYGRYLVELFMADGSSVNTWLLESGHAVAYPKE